MTILFWYLYREMFSWQCVISQIFANEKQTKNIQLKNLSFFKYVKYKNI